MNAHETMWACRDLWDKQNDQLSFETSPPAGNYGSPDALLATLQARGVNPGASTNPASTDGGSPCSVTLPPGEERGAGLISTATAAEPVRVGAAVAGGDST